MPEDAELFLIQGDENFRANLNAKGGSSEELTIKGSEGVLVEAGGTVKIAWGSQPQFLLCGRLPREDMIRIAESVTPSPEIKEKEEELK